MDRTSLSFLQLKISTYYVDDLWSLGSYAVMKTDVDFCDCPKKSLRTTIASNFPNKDCRNRSLSALISHVVISI